MGKAICVDELRDMLSALDGGLMAALGDGELLIVDDDGSEVDYIPFYEEV